MSTVAQFPPASLEAQLAELRRERRDRAERRDAIDLSSKRATIVEAAHRNNALDGAVKTLERLVEAQARGEPGRKELIEALREAVHAIEQGCECPASVRDVLAKVRA